MIEYDNGGILITDLSELPNFKGARKIYADFETTSGDPKITSLNPWKDCGICGLAITVDDCKRAYYIPVDHAFGPNVDPEPVWEWWNDIVDHPNVEYWANANVKYDVHVSANCAGVDAQVPLHCLTTQAKLINSDRMRFGLKELSRDWLKHDISRYEDAMQPYLKNNKDYGRIPSDICGEYACQDVLTARHLDKYIKARMPEESKKVLQTEIDLTSMLVEMERDGMTVNHHLIAAQEIAVTEKMFDIDEKLSKLTGREFRPHVNEDCYDILCNMYGLPILEWTDTGNASFDKKALAAYAAHPFAPHEVVSLISEYRKLNTFVNFFLKPYQELHVDNILHPLYNQCVRTGRMSCSKPNSQQLNKLAKMLILPGEGNSFLSYDFSQIEFRHIVHYIQDQRAIKAYKSDPFTDFHAWVAELCGIQRSPAKNVNFAIAFGGGKGMVLEMLSGNLDLVGELKEVARQKADTEEAAMQIFSRLCDERAKRVYTTYHSRLPNLKATSRHAARVAEQRGYIRNLHGRRRYLPETRCHIAFNTLNQSSAADLMKERIVALWKAVRAAKMDELRFTAQVHDEVLMKGPHEMLEDPIVINDIVYVMQDTDVALRVPIRGQVGMSRKNWASCNDELKIDAVRPPAGRLFDRSRSREPNRAVRP